MPSIVVSDRTIFVKETYDQIKSRIESALDALSKQDLVFIEVSAFERGRMFGGTVPVLINIVDIRRVEWTSS